MTSANRINGLNELQRKIRAHSLSCLVNRLEGTTELCVTDEPTSEEIENDTANLLRYVRMRR